MDEYEDPLKARERLLDIIAGTEELISETRRSRLEIAQTEKEVEDERKTTQTNDFRYHLQREQIRRAYENVDFILRGLERQKKIAVQKLHELD